MRARPSRLALVLLLGVLASPSSCAVPTAGPCTGGASSGPGSDDSELCRDACTVSLSCPLEAPICDANFGLCRACSAGEDRRCRERGAGSMHCVDGRCVACVAPRGVPAEVTDCPSATPICADMSCRACTRHSECQSGVCAKDDSGAALGTKLGSCVPIEQVLVVDQDLCSRTGPVFCTPQQAFAHVGPLQPYVLLRRGATPDDFTSLTFGDLPAQTTQLVRIIGPLADNPPHRAPSLPQVVIGNLAGKNGLSISHGRVILEGLFVRDTRVGISCTGADSDVQVVRSLFSGNATALSASSGCKLTIAESWIGSGPTGTGFTGLPGNARSLEVSGAEFHIVNTLLVDDGDYRQDALGGIRIKSLGGSARSTVVNTTFYQQAGVLKGGKYLTTLLCDVPVGDRLVFFNSLLLGDTALSLSPEEHYFDPACGVRIDHVGSNDAGLSANGSVLLPTDASMFVDAKGRDLRPLSGGDPGRSAITQGGLRSTFAGSDEISAPLSDLDGRPRQLTDDRLSLGAFEPVASPAP